MAFISKFLLLTAMPLSLSMGGFAQNQVFMQPIHPNAPVQSKQSIVINASPAKVWQVLTDIDQWASWQTDISSPKLTGGLRPSSTFVWKTGGAKVRSKLHTVSPNQYFGWTGKTYGMFAVHNWSLREDNGRTTVAVEESMEGFLAGLFKKKFNKNLEKGMRKWLELLKKECEK